jgi:hypothetical protein
MVGSEPLPYLVMEFIPGETLQQRLDRTSPLETVEVVQFGRQVVRVSQEAPPSGTKAAKPSADGSAWERSGAGMLAEEQVKVDAQAKDR